MSVAESVEGQIGHRQLLHELGECLAYDVGVERRAERGREDVAVFLPAAADELTEFVLSSPVLTKHLCGFVADVECSRGAFVLGPYDLGALHQLAMLRCKFCSSANVDTNLNGTSVSPDWIQFGGTFSCGTQISRQHRVLGQMSSGLIAQRNGRRGSWPGNRSCWWH